MINKIINQLEQKNIAILGFGKEGQSTYEFIRKYKKELPLTILDQKEDLKNDPSLQADRNLRLIVGEDYLKDLERYDCIIKTPGISLKDIKIENIQSKITSQIELLLEVKKENVIGITGTKGKSTTTSIIYNLIKKQNPNVVLVGNIGTPVLSVLESCDENTIFVMEISSHQLEFLKVSPHIGIILNLFEDHLDHAGSVEHYHNIKLNMFRNQTKEDLMIYCSDNETLNKLIKQQDFKSKPYTVNMKNIEPSDVYLKEGNIYYKEKEIYRTSYPRKLLGNHNLENIVVALLVGTLIGLNNDKMKETIKEFEPLDYRLQKIAEQNNVEYYVDTLATIPEATIKSIETLKKVNTLIFGGMDRGINYQILIDYLAKSPIEHFICMPTTAHKISEFLPKSKVFLVNTLEEAVELAKRVTKKGSICLLSPAAPSYDQFKNYKEKGDKYKEYITKKN